LSRTLSGISPSPAIDRGEARPISGRAYRLCLVAALVAGIGLTYALVEAQARVDTVAVDQIAIEAYQQLAAQLTTTRHAQQTAQSRVQILEAELAAVRQRLEGVKPAWELGNLLERCASGQR
jgi:LPS O-antigen subunit length determinant protein (WzzB/FepE family)